MPMYAYKGLGPSGKNVNGVKDAESPKLLRQVLRKDGVIVTSFELSKGGKAQKAHNATKGGLSKDVDLGAIFGSVKKVEIAAFTRQAATLLRAGSTLPLNTRILIATSGFFGRNILWLFLGTIIGIVLFMKWSRSKEGKPIWHAFVLRLPVVGELVRTINVGRFSRTLGTMLQSGVPMLRALDTGKQIVGNVLLQRAIEDAKQAVTEGEGLAVTLRTSGQV